MPLDIGGLFMWKWEADGHAKAVVVLIHSAFENYRWYAWTIDKLRSEGYHVVSGDLPGHEEGSKYTRVHDEKISDFLNYIKILMKNALEFNLPVFIIGNGLGGLLAIHFLHKNNAECAGLVLNSPWVALKKTPGAISNALAGMGSLASGRKISLKFDRKMLTRNIDGYEEMLDEVRYHSNVTVRWYKEIQLLMRTVLNQKDISLSLPILLMTAKKDQITEPDISRAWLLSQNSDEMQYKLWPYSYHNLLHDNEREEVFIYIRDFMNNVIRSLGFIV